LPAARVHLLGSLSAALVLAGGDGMDSRADPRANDRTLRDTAHRYRVELADGWRRLEPPAGTLAAYAAEHGRAHLAITRVDLGTRSARDPGTLGDQVERGVESATRGYRRRRRALSTSAQVPVLDLFYERAAGSGRELILSRYLLFPRHTVVLSIGLADGAHRRDRRAAEAMVKSFTPLR
jgi:hypothetical protein